MPAVHKEAACQNPRLRGLTGGFVLYNHPLITGGICSCLVCDHGHCC